MEESPTIVSFLKEIYNIWITDRPARLAAGLAYYGIFSLVPIVFISLTIAGIFLDELALAERLFNVVENVLGSQAATFIEESVNSMEQTTTGGTFLRSLISFIALLLAASGFFFNLQTSLNTIWHVPPPDHDGTRAYIIDKFASFIMVIGVGILLVATAVLSVLVRFLGSVFPLDFITPVINLLAFILVVMVSIGLIYKVLPDVQVSWRDVWLGSLVTTLMMIVGVFIFGWYLTSGSSSSAFEAAGSVAVILIGIYTFAQIFLIGAVFTRVYARMFGSLSLNNTNGKSVEGNTDI
jgi:membrane protein